ncbi:MAG: Ig-like domain-containing protein, partial [Solirubrobacterales bacterium]
KATVSITVSCVDDPPVAVNDSAGLAEDSSATAIEVLANDTDIDGGVKSIASKTNGAHGTVSVTGGGTGLTYLPDPNSCGLDSFTYTLNGGSTATASITIYCVDDPPVAVNDSATMSEDASTQAIDVLANDSDVDGGARSIAAKTSAAHGTVAITNEAAEVSYTPDPNYCGPDSFDYTVNGGSRATVSVTVSCVDDPPLAVKDSAAVNEEAGATPIDVLANDTDIDGGSRSIASRTNGAHGSVAINAEESELAYIPDPGYCGPDSFSYTLNGGSTATVSVTVSCVDHLPVAADDSATVNEDATATPIDVLANDADIDGGPKSIAAKTTAAHGAVVAIGAGAALTYTPVANYCGPDSFSYTLNGGSTATVSVTVNCVDDSPVAVDDSASLAEDATATPIDVLANDTDIDGGPKSITTKTNAAHGTVATEGAGAGVTYTPNPNYCGSDFFTYTANGGSQATVSITVSCADDPPVAVNDFATVAEDASATAIEVLANDTDIDGGPKAVTGSTNGAHGSVAVIEGGTAVTYVPDPNYCGPDSFSYTLNEGATATVSVTVACVYSGVDSGTPAASQPEGSSGPVINVTPGIDVLSGRRHPRVAIKGSYTFFTLTCALEDHDCTGNVTITATLPGVVLGARMEQVVLVKGQFRIEAGRSVLVRADLTRHGLEVLDTRRSLHGMVAEMVIADTASSERGSIQVNLVRRPKASLLPRGGGGRSG